MGYQVSRISHACRGRRRTANRANEGVKSLHSFKSKDWYRIPNMAEPPTISSFVRSIGSQWITRMSGPLTVPFALVALFVPQTWLKASSAVLAILCASVSSYGVWSQERKARNVAEKQKEELEWPPDRPKISFTRWGQVENESGARVSQHGFYLANDGGAALEVNVERFSIDQTLSASGATVARIEGGKQGFAPIWLENEPNLIRGLCRAEPA